MPQYALELTLPPVFSADNFFVSACNRDAWQWVEAWPNWPAHAFLLYGPVGSGKSHLGQIWAARAHASVVSAATLAAGEAGKGNWLVEDSERLADERTLLHLLNGSRENGGTVLLTSLYSAANLPFTLPDLTSRLLALPTAGIAQADDAVLSGAIRKQFADRQMNIDDDVISYLLPRMERSLAKAKALVEKLDQQALAEAKNITVPFVKRVLEQMQE